MKILYHENRKNIEHSQKPADMSDEDWAEANMLFSKGIDNLAAGAYAGFNKDEEGNITFDPEKFVLGLGGYTAVKAALKNKQVQGVLKEYAQKAIDTIDMNPQVYKENALNAMSPVKSKEQKEMRGIYNVTFNGKNATEVRKTDSEAIVKYERGYEDEKTGKGRGSIHIEKHLADGSIGEVSKEELLKIGEVIRYGDIRESHGKNVYELKKNGVNFTVVTGSTKNGKERVITFYSDRNLNVDAHSSGAITSTTSKDNIIPQTKDELNKNILHANAGESLAGGFGGGSETIAAQRDWNEDGKVDGADVLYGAVAGALGLKTTLGGLKRVNPKAYNAIIGASETFPAMAKNNPKLLAELHKNGKANSINMFAGTKAIKADVGQLDDAMKLIDDGASETDVWKKTGWFKGDDGKWRFEVDDSGIKTLSKKELDALAKADPYEMAEVPLSQVIKHDKLFEAYPQLRDVQVNWEYSKAKGLEDEKNIYYGASYDPQEKLITIGNGLDDKQIKSSLLHEVQHAVQNIEGFARGGSTTSKEYNLLHGEAEARLTQTRADKGYEKFPYDDLDAPRGELIKKFDGGAAEMAKKLEDRYIINGKVDEQALLSDAEPFKKVAYTKENFAKQFGVEFGETAFIKTPKGVPDVYLDTRSQYYKLDGKNYKEDRKHLVGVINDIFTNPLFVVEHNGANKFFAIFNDNGKGIYAVSVTEKEGIIEVVKSNYTPILRGDKTKIDFKYIKELMEINDDGVLYFKHQGDHDSKVKSYSEHNVNEVVAYSGRGTHQLDEHTTRQMSVLTPANESIAKDYKDSQGFYSVLEKTIDEKVGGRIDSASLSKMLEKNGVKQDEIEWSGLKELMESKEKLSKEEIENIIKANRLEVEVVEKDSRLDKETINSLKMYDNERFAAIEGKIPKYSEYKLDGGENYRELLFRKPVKLPEDVKFIKADDGYWYAEKAPYDGTNVLSSAKNKVALEKEFGVKEFKSGHWDEGNILAFTRVDDRTIDNKKALFVEEIQSDWHQEGRKKGYGKKGVPEAPFEKNWHEFTLKRLLQEAVANDYEKIAWTTGKQQADRYSLEKTVDTVVYNKDAGALQATNGSKEVFFKRVANEKEIEDIMGKELTARLLDKKSAKNDSIHILQGEELKFGGEGMGGFYDEILPNSAKKLFKKWGVKPKMEELDDVEQMVWSVDITPAMKDDIKKYGQPLYAKEEISAGLVTGVEYDEDGNISGFNIENFLFGAAGGHALSKALKKEKRGIFNVTHNDKNMVKIRKNDIESLNEYIKYEKGNTDKGAVHI